MIGYPVKKKWQTIAAICLFVSCFLLASCGAVPEQTNTANQAEPEITVAGIETIAALAAQQLEDMREAIDDSYEVLGFEKEAFLNMSVGTPFITYGFDRSGNLLSDDVYSCPLIYQDQVVGIIYVYYSEASQSYSYQIGAEFGPELNVLKDSDILDSSHGVLIGRIDDKLFATDGMDVVILSDVPLEPAVSIEEIRAVAGRLIDAASANYQPFVSIRTVSPNEGSEMVR